MAAKYKAKIARALEHDMAVVETLRDQDTCMLEVDAYARKSDIARKVQAFALGGLHDPRWPLDILAELRDAAAEVGVEAWLTSGSVYRAFWNHVFGPVQESFDLDIVVASERDVVILKSLLESRYQQRRWSVFSWQQHASIRYNVDSPDLLSNLGCRALTFRQAAVRLDGDSIVFAATPSALKDLHAGVIRLDENAISRLSGPNRAYHLDKSVATLPRLLSEYPGLSLAGTLTGLFSKTYGHPHTPVFVDQSWEDKERSVHEAEHGGRPAWLYGDWTLKERHIAQGIVDFYRQASHMETAPPVASKTELPAELSGANRGGCPQHDVPADYGGWLHFMASTCGDNQFREWLVNQTRSQQPVGGADPDLADVLSLAKFSSDDRVRNPLGVQKATHGGWTLPLHTKHSMLQLRTDAAPENVQGNLTVDEVRLAMRLTMLYHDVGKLISVHTPGGHSGTSAQMFMKYKPTWVSAEVAALAAFLIHQHDIFGRVSRGITEKLHVGLFDTGFDVGATPSYRGAVDPPRARTYVSEFCATWDMDFEQVISLLGLVWEADVGSVAALRWLLPVSAQITALLTCKTSSP